MVRVWEEENGLEKIVAKLVTKEQDLQQGVVGTVIKELGGREGATDDQDIRELEPVSTLQRCEQGHFKRTVGHVYVTRRGKRVVEWMDGFDPNTARMIEVPVQEETD